MKTIGLIGGMSWESTVTYYQIINSVIRNQLGGLHSAKCILYSVNFEEIEACQVNSDWERSGQILADAAVCLEKAGADFIVICTNTMHKVVQHIEIATTIPILHIADVTADEIIKTGISSIVLLGTKYTMEQEFYKCKLVKRGIKVLIPNEKEIEIVNNTIYNELCLGIIKETSKKAFLNIIERLAEQGVEGVILGCTEIGMLVKQIDTKVQLFDTTYIHAEKAALLSIV